MEENKKFFDDGCEIREMTEGEKEIAKGLDEFFEQEEQKTKNYT